MLTVVVIKKSDTLLKTCCLFYKSGVNHVIIHKNNIKRGEEENVCAVVPLLRLRRTEVSTDRHYDHYIYVNVGICENNCLVDINKFNGRFPCVLERGGDWNVSNGSGRGRSVCFVSREGNFYWLEI